MSLRRVLLLIVPFLAALSCGGGAGAPGRLSELLLAVPADAVCAGQYSRLDNALAGMSDTLSPLRKISAGSLSRSEAVLALCNVGRLVPLLVVDAGRCSADTSAALSGLVASCDSLRLPHMIVQLGKRKAFVASTSHTVLDVSSRHIKGGASLFDAPHFTLVQEAFPDGDAVVCRSESAKSWLSCRLPALPAKVVNRFVKEASAWTIISKDAIRTVQPSSASFFCNMLEALHEQKCRLSAVLPDTAALAIGLPMVADGGYRAAYESWCDARAVLPAYNKRLQACEKASGKNPLDWEKEQGVKEVALVLIPASDGGFYRLNMVRTSSSSREEPKVVKNACAGFVRALYGEVFEVCDSCVLRSSEWLVSGSAEALDAYRLPESQQALPSSAKALVYTPGGSIVCTKDRIEYGIPVCKQNP